MQIDRLRNWIHVAVLVLFCGRAAAEYRFDVWTTDSGLPHNTVRGLVQSRDGYLWAGTLDGLARFDGVRFTVFNRANSPGLPNNRIVALHEASDGALWMGFEDGSVARYQHGGFTAFGAKDGLPTGAVAAIGGDDDGNPWVLSQSLLLRLRDGRFRPDFPESAAGLFPRPGIGWNDAAGIWMTTPDALHFVSHGKLTTLGLSNGLPSLRISLVLEDPPGTLWLGTEDAGLVKFRDGRVVKRFTQQNGLPRDQVGFGPGAWSSPKLCEDRKGNLWLTGTGPWLCRLKDGFFFAYSPTNTPTLHGLAQTTSDLINALLEDSEGNLWIATERNGIIRAREQVMNMIPAEQGLRPANIYPICEDRTGAVWFGAWSQGLARVAAGVVTDFPQSPQLFLATALCEDRAGQLWVATYGGVRIFQDGTLTEAGVPRGLTNGVVHAICQDRSGGLWFGAEHGLSRYHDGQLSLFTERDGLAGGSIFVIIEDRAGALWIGSHDGLTRWANGRFTAWTEREGLPSNHVRALYEDGDGTLWIGSADGGLGRFKAGRFTRYTTKEGLFDDGVFQILEDARGNFWMSSNRGIHRVNKRELNEFAEGRRHSITSLAYGKNDGMLDAECNGGRWPAGVKTRDGKLWFPTQNGVAVIDPEALSANLKPPPAVIEGFLLDREPQALDRPLRVPPGKANIEIDYTGLSFINSDWLSFKYRLAGVDDDWVEVGRRRAAYYSHVAPGHYTFTVLAANSDGVWNETGASLDFAVLPAWHQTKWFRALVFVALAAAAVSVYRWRLGQSERKRRQQEAFSRRLIESQDAERKRIAAELHDSLGQELLLIKNRALLGLKAQPDGETSHASSALAVAASARETPSPNSKTHKADSISESMSSGLVFGSGGAVGETPGSNSRTHKADSVSEFLSSSLAFREHLEEISRLTSQALQGVRDIAYNLRPYQLDQFGLTEGIAAVVHKLGSASDIHFTVEVDSIDNVFSPADESHLFRVIQEATNNIVKHSRASRASVRVERGDKSLRVLIEDNGRGFHSVPDGKIDSSAVSKSENQKGGFGLPGMAERVRILGGTLQVKSAPGQGTQLDLTIPIPSHGQENSGAAGG